MNYIEMNKKYAIRMGFMGMGLLILSGCVTIPIETTHVNIRQATLYEKPDPTIQFKRDQWPQLEWWKSFQDSQLTVLIEKALQGTPTLEVAAARLRLAQRAVQQIDSSHAPMVSGNGTISRELESENGLIPPPYGGSWLTNSRAALDFSYELDWWGKNKALINAAVGQTRAAQADYASAQLILTTSIAQTYFTYQVELQRLDNAKEAVQHYNRLLKLNQLRLKQGLDPITVQQQTEGNLASSHLNQALIQTNIELTQSKLQALLGVSAQEALPLKMAHLPIGHYAFPRYLGLDLVSHRPDLQAAIWQVNAALENVKAAKAEFYPNINLTAFLGFTSLSLNQLVEMGSKTAGIAPAIHIPLFDSGRLKATLAVRHANADLAIAQYNQTLVNAVQDVTDQALTLHGLLEQEHSVKAVLGAAQQTQQTITLKSKQGLVDDSVLIQATIKVVMQKELYLQLINRCFTAHVNLIRALGGGYMATGEHHHD